MRKDTQTFIKSAMYDIQTAQDMLDRERHVYVVFMCHLAIEKMLKALVTETTGRVAPKTHNLIYLTKLAGAKLPQHLFDFITKINNASVVTRYPEDFMELIKSYTKEIALEYLKNSKETLSWLSQNPRLKE